MTQPLRFAVIGQPIAHSLSPTIHAAFARQRGIVLEYTAIEAGPEALAETLERFDGHGANITLPHKVAAFGLCASTTERARRARAVNTLTRTAEGWEGDNTDGSGLVRDLTERRRLDLRGRRVLLLGAGGAAQGVAPLLLDAGIDEMVVVNRSPERADALCSALGDPARAHSRYWDDLRGLGDFEMIVNATSAGRATGQFDIPFSLPSPRCLAVDLSYGEAAVPFLAWARAAGCVDVVDGLGMLVEQAADSFARWHGVRPDTEAVYAMLRAREDALVTAD
ncbi:shikimate dehydrogenase [Coralloluteibacterium stylophorae]|uniref:Shikimate dehydrogenase (NADP(+)) n=1 Tax=Coralloluteibacterium stylophorae TaxID=1776034 RepID=A0A8J8AXK3_9GAMM|nr:shikimate dehydrogenase [Coralloluteibacterium stylophorae]MBS7457070.1 shikimate dehydrogenase [Coralloluteibacterium stylophorae]